MNKPITMIVKETKAKLARACNESGLTPVMLDLIVYGIYSEIHALAEKQAADDEALYIKGLESQNIGHDEPILGPEILEED